jgi:NADPH2:quinone reductase
MRRRPGEVDRGAPAGQPEVLELTDGPVPEPGPGEARVAVGAAGVNFRDLQQRSGGYPARTPFVMGAEGAGYTEEAVVPADRAVG